MNCPGSLGLSEGIKSGSSVYAQEGTLAHSLAEEALTKNVPAAELTDNLDMAKAVQVYLDEINMFRGLYEVILEETEITLESLEIDGLGGTADHFMAYVDGDKVVLHCFDYKHGVGVYVDAEENKQVLSYFAIIESHYPGLFDTFRATIVQPRSPQWSQSDPWECGVDRVRQHVEQIVASRSQDHLCAGDWCRWCPALMICPEVQENARRMAKTEFNEIDTETLLEMERIAPAVERFIKRIPIELLDRFKREGGIKGKKVIERLGHRSWNQPPDDMMNILSSMGLPEDAIVEKRLRTPPQVEKSLPKEDRKLLSDYTERRVVGYKVVPESSRGIAVDILSTDLSEFSEIEES